MEIKELRDRITNAEVSLSRLKKNKNAYIERGFMTEDEFNSNLECLQQEIKFCNMEINLISKQ